MQNLDSYLDSNFSFANFSGANLSFANLDNANFIGAKFWYFSRREAKNITREQIKKAKNWEKAIYSPEFCQKLGLPSEEETDS